MAIKWKDIAREKGFTSIYSMLHDLFERYEHNIQALSQYLQISHPIVRKQLVELGLVKSGLKMGSHPGVFVCRHCGGVFEGDRRKVCCSNDICIEKEKEYHKERVLASLQLRKSKNKEKKNACRICGRDKGVNRFFCNHCLQYVDSGNMAEGL